MTEIKKGLNNLENDLNSGHGLVSTADRYYRQYEKNKSRFAAVLLGSSRDELQKEIEAAKSGVEKSFSGNGDWSTPRGSMFSANPLSREGKVALHIQEVSAPMFIAGVPSSKCIRGCTSLTSSL
ncbi:MAG: hypothetical protein CM1200mP30_12960 [Pseudomonadota bacterium]|nr:MAG: hypothetical protein CM1200mP30_12960 [Pseudomonadota bacterium]